MTQLGAAKIVEGRRFIEPVSLEPGIGDPENPDAAGRNNADTDHDGDSVADSSDAFPLDASEPLDTDSDSTGNSADPDDEYPLDASRAAPGKARLQNISTRVLVQTGDDVLMGGFIITGTEPKAVVIRARGPCMAEADPNLIGLLEDPYIQLFSVRH